MFTISSLLRFVLLFGAALPTGVVSRPAVEKRVAPPSSDPFYTPPAGYQNTAPGTILRSRQVASAIFGLVPNPVPTYQLLYRSTAINGSAIADATTIFVPVGAKKDRFVSFQTAYDSSAPVCDPSYNYQLGSQQVSLIASIELLLLEGYLLGGYIVASSDYEGPDAAFGPGRLSGMGVLDGMRAVTNFKSTLKLTTNTPTIVGVGYSGGGIATGWAASLQPNYAPELKIAGWASGGTPANLTGTFLFIDNTIFSGFQPAGVDGLSKPSAYGARLNPLINSIITPYGRSVLDYANANCGPSDLIEFPYNSVLTTKFQTLGPALLQNPTIRSVLAQNTMGVNRNETPTAPVFLYHASNDEIIPYANATTLRQAWCNYGASVNFRTFAAGGHLTTEILGFPDQFKFVQSAFAGTTLQGCTQSTTLNNTLDPLALGANLEPVLIQLLQLLHDIGNQDSNVLQNLTMLEG